MAGPAAPTGAGPAGRRLWRELLKVYEFGEWELAQLREIVKVVDLVGELHQALNEGGLTDSKGGKRWEVAELRLQRKLLAQLLSAIRIPADVGERAADSAPPSRTDSDGDGAGRAPRTQRRGVRGVYPMKLVGGQDR